MKNKVVIIMFAFLAIPILLMGCGSKAQATPTTNPNLIYTAAAQTAAARVTQFFRATPSAAPATPTATFNLTQTAAAQTASAMLTQTASITPTPPATSAYTPAPPGSSGDRATFVADVTIPDRTVIAPGAAFTKTWKLQNGGSSTWTTSYSLAFIGGEQMGTVTSVKLDQNVPPGAQIDISVDMVAPSTTGSYQANWKMKNASGQFFDDAVYVLIEVGSGGIAPTSTGGAPGATSTPTTTGTPGNPITSLTMSVNQGSFTGPCPYSFSFAATFTLSQGATLTYNLDAGSDTPGFQFNLPAAQTSTFGPGTYSLTFPMEFTSTGTGWVRFHVTSPVDTTSNQATFNLTCNP